MKKRLSTYAIFSQPKANGNILLVNGKTGVIDELTPELAHCLQNADRHPELLEKVPQEMLSELLARGYLTQESPEEELQSLTHLPETQETPKSCAFTLVPTMSCNYRCTYCFQRKNKKEPSPVMSRTMLQSAYTAMETLRRLFDQPIADLTLYGGEPLLKEPGGLQFKFGLTERAEPHISWRIHLTYISMAQAGLLVL